MSLRSIRVRRDGHVAVVTLNRPGSGNAIDETMAAELRETSERLDQDDGIRTVVITGEGESFSRGTDPSALEAMGEDQTGLRSLRVAEAVAAIEKPVIAAINGDAIDQGLELALACDIRVASDRARFALTQVAAGVIPWDGGTQRLPRIIGPGRATEMVLTCRSLDSREAQDIGLISRVTTPRELLADVGELAAAIAANAPIATRYVKEAMAQGLDMTIAQGLSLEADLNVILQSTADRAEGIRSFLERRAPEYAGE